MIKCKDLTKIYGDGRTKVLALRSLNLSIERGELLGIRGPSGSGKTTLLNILAYIDRPSAGVVLIDGRSLADLEDDDIDLFRRKTVGVVFQFFNLIPNLSVIENIELPMAIDGVKSKERKGRAIEILRMVGIEILANRRPDEISGGEKQRTAIAIALANNPKIIVADEPTGELDQENAMVVMNIFKELNQQIGTTVLIASHDELILSQVNRVITLRDGAVVSDSRAIDEA